MAKIHHTTDWLMSLAMDLAALWICGGKHGTNGCHLTGFSEDVDFVCHFVAPHSPTTLPPCRSASGIGCPSKKLSKMANNSASY